ncbi:hypothetical protein [Mesohalobacter halotolerans]|uniref:DUF91 domain-containing protein n=1 Tax=Mesohalobacter halotolerans TaxID=1883405 RepID=A0A4U5TRA5_9FLAO|nr:hypothetical protein [Mesohalobacter halotolerans]TKS56492.1 hypothetical protein FCN74_05495 [Mesohalobacter halotolerans]
MSKKETWRTRKYWSEVGGMLIEEFIAVKGSKASGKRLIDGLIILGEEHKIYEGKTYDIEGKDVIIVQTKAYRIGMYLLGQAYFSQYLIKNHKPKSIKSVAICSKNDEVISQIANTHNVEIVVISDNDYDQKHDVEKYKVD